MLAKIRSWDEYLIMAIGDDVYAHLSQTTETTCRLYNGHHGETTFHSCCYNFIFGNKRVKVYENDDCPYSMAIHSSNSLDVDDKHDLSLDDVVVALHDLLKEEENGNS